MEQTFAPDAARRQDHPVRLDEGGRLDAIAVRTLENNPMISPVETELQTMNPTLKARLIRFLQEELLLPADSIAVALRQDEPIPSLLPMILWQYGLVTLEQLERIFDWLETA